MFTHSYEMCNCDAPQEIFIRGFSTNSKKNIWNIEPLISFDGSITPTPF